MTIGVKASFLYRWDFLAVTEPTVSSTEGLNGWGYHVWGYSNHKSVHIPMAAIHINTSSTRVQIALVQVISAWIGAVFRQPV